MTEFELKIKKYYDEILADGLPDVAKRYSLKVTKKGKLDRRTKIGRVLQPMLDDLIF